jgi:prolyl-tRNA synthetase
MSQVASIIKKSENISEWYSDVIEQAKLAEHGPVKGTMIWRPRGFALWEAIQKNLDEKIKAMGAESVYFPLFIPESFLKKEKEHVEGFSPELAVVTHGGGEKLAEPIVVRPTSETIMYDAFSRWIQSFRDLPLIVNQWANVVRWEKRPYFFLRTTEFLWQEGHTAHATNEEAEEMAQKALNMYIEFYQNFLGLFGYAGQKSQSEKFPGADKTLTYEILMPDGKVVQACTSHNLGQNFAKAFKVKFQDNTGKEQLVSQTSWGLTSRSIGAMILMHGDDNGLVLPPNVAPIQVVIITITTKESDKGAIEKTAQKALEILETNGVRVKIDDSDDSPGRKFNQADLEGIPLRVEIGASEVRENKLRVVRRDSKQSFAIPTDVIGAEVSDLLESIQKDLLEKSKKLTHDNTKQADTYEDFKKIMNDTRGFIEAFWCEDPKCEAKIKEETKATTRCLPLGAVETAGKCIYCEKDATHRWLFAQSY